MTCRVQASGAIELFFYGELPAAERAAVQAHLAHCGDCRQALDDLTVIRAALAARPDVATPPGGDWSGFMDRLSVAVQRDAGLDTAVRDLRTPAAAPTSGRLLSMPARRRVMAALALAALLALVTFGVLLVDGGRDGVVPGLVDRTASAPPAEAPRAAVQPASAPGGIDPALVSLSGAHFERSKLVVLGLATRDSNQPGGDDWSHERELATSLLRDTRLYRVAAEERGMARLAGVMRDLELVLLQTSMSVDPDPAALEQLQRLIRRRDLLTKMNTVAVAGP